jgi:HEPN domain-containing protein
MNDKTSHGRLWLAKANSDLAASRRLLDAGGPYDAVCFHAQQAAEKALKAWLAIADAPIPRTHDLEELQALCLALPQPQMASGLEALDLSNLTPFAVEARYDVEFWPERGEAEAAVAIAAQVCVAVARIVESAP